jgi:hypothetical protein
MKIEQPYFGFGKQKRYGITLLLALLATLLNGCGLEVFLGPHDPSPFPTPPTSMPELLEALTDSDYRMRLSVIAALSKLGPEAEVAIPALTKALSDNVSDVRTAAAYALRDIGPAAAPAVPELVKMMQTDVARGARRAAAEALGRLGDISVVPDLAAILYTVDASQSLMVAAARSLAYLTENPFTDSEPGSYGHTSDGTPVIVIEARDWWKSEGQYQQWSDIDPE